jgi:glucose/arabinose dehydrogenase
VRRVPVLLATTALIGAATYLSSSASVAAPQHARHAGHLTSAVVPPSHVRLSWHTVVAGLSSPVSVTNAGDGSGRLFVVEQPGDVRIVRSGHLIASPYLDIRSKVTSGDEQGLLSIAFHPDFAKHPKVYTAYTRSDGDLVVASFRAASARANRVSQSTERQIILIPHHGATNHNGGQIFFGRDGYLYITTGDGGGEGDQFRRADTRDNLTGKILRIDVDRSCGRLHYCIPSNNPYARSKAYRHEIIAWGLRNPWRASLDPITNTLWIGDVGQDTYEEIDHVGVPAAHDFGWSCKEARATYNAEECGHRKITRPVWVIPHNPGGVCAIIGGYVYRGTRYAAVAGGLYVYSDNCSGRVWGLRKIGGKWRNAQIGSVSGGPSGFGVSQGGELYVVTLDGVLHRASFSKR